MKQTIIFVIALIVAATAAMYLGRRDTSSFTKETLFYTTFVYTTTNGFGFDGSILKHPGTKITIRDIEVMRGMIQNANTNYRNVMVLDYKQVEAQ